VSGGRLLTLAFKIGSCRSVKGEDHGAFELNADDLVTHAVVVGMTGSGKTGLLTVLVEEALRNEIPVLLLEVKGDLASLHRIGETPIHV
jgi:type IV secretory pathway VirB4 component